MTNGFGAMLSMHIDGTPRQAQEVACKLKVITIGASLGGVESLVEHRASVEGPDSAVPPNMLRFSIGIEPEALLIGDLEQALSILKK
jgi:cystathionine gamma-synthase